MIRSRLTWHAERGRSDSPCERPCAGRGRPLAASLAPSAAEGTRPPHVCRYALHQLALQIACARGVCVLARARARQNLTMKLPLPASIIHIPASATCRSHIPVTGTVAEPVLHWCHISATAGVGHAVWQCTEPAVKTAGTRIVKRQRPGDSEPRTAGQLESGTSPGLTLQRCTVLARYLHGTCSYLHLHVAVLADTRREVPWPASMQVQLRASAEFCK